MSCFDAKQVLCLLFPIKLWRRSKRNCFFFPNEKKDSGIRYRWIRIVNREGWKPSKKSCICRKHFEHHYYKAEAQGKRCRLVKKLKPVDNIFSQEESRLSAEPKDLKSLVSVLRKSWTKRVYQQDNFKLFEQQDKIKNFDNSDSTVTPPGYTFQKYEEYVVFYCLETNASDFVTEGTIV